MRAPSSAEPLVVLDDDPTGPQLGRDLPVALTPDARAIAAAAADGAPALHVLTNARAEPAAVAYRLARKATAAALHVSPNANVIARGDSTLRGHVHEEYRAIRDVVFPHDSPALLLVPALPAAGRVTVNGVQVIECDGRRVPLHETEYARDGAFSYGDAHLLGWAHERSGGELDRARGVEVPLERLRRGGPDTVRDGVAAIVESGRPAVCAPDAETMDDLELIAEGWRRARADGMPVVVRCGPAFATVLTGGPATGLLPVPRSSRGLLLVCGSYVPATLRQLDRLRASCGRSFVELDVERLRVETAGEVDRVVRTARDRLIRERVAIVVTPPVRDGRLESLELGARVAAALADVVSRARTDADLLVFKGGVTSAVCLRDGLCASHAVVRGPVAKGVALWDVAGVHAPCLVVPGNVGAGDLLAEIVERALGR